VADNVIERTGRVVIPGGSPADLVVRTVSKRQIALDLQAIMMDGTRYQVLSDSATVQGTNKSGLGVNKRTAEFVVEVRSEGQSLAPSRAEGQEPRSGRLMEAPAARRRKF
jgi:hypothetical protein